MMQFDDFSFPLDPRGAHAALPTLLAIRHPVNTPWDSENYVARLEHLAPRIKEVNRRAQLLIDEKMTPPKFILERAVTQIDKFLSVPPSKNALVDGFDGRMAKVSGLSSEKRAELRAAPGRITTEQVYPAWRKAQALLQKHMPSASDDAGLWRLPGGLEAYDAYLKRATTTNMAADEIHRTGLKLVSEIEQHMDKLLRELGFTKGTFRQRLANAREAAPVFPSTEEGRAKYIAEIERYIADAEKRGALLFERVPKAKVLAQAYPEFRGLRAASHMLAAPDGSRPDVYRFPEYGVPLTTFGLRAQPFITSRFRATISRRCRWRAPLCRDSWESSTSAAVLRTEKDGAVRRAACSRIGLV